MAIRTYHPIQPIELVNGVLRFKENRIVRHLVDSYPNKDNCIMLRFGSDEFDDDYSQLMQLVGYSVSGFGDIDRVPRALVDRADVAACRVMIAEEYRR